MPEIRPDAGRRYLVLLLLFAALLVAVLLFAIEVLDIPDAGLTGLAVGLALSPVLSDVRARLRSLAERGPRV